MSSTQRGLACTLWLTLLVCISTAAPANELAKQLEQALRQNNLEAVRALVNTQSADVRLQQRKTPLMLAGKYAALPAVRYLLDIGADANAKTANGGTPLMFAAISGEPQVLRALLRAGADPNAVGGFRWTALMVAASKGHPEAVSVLIKSGADINARDTYGWTPLMRAISGGKWQTFDALVAHPRIDLNATEERRASALHIAAEHDEQEMAKALVKAGADTQTADRDGLIPADYARAKGHASLANWLTLRAKN